MCTCSSQYVSTSKRFQKASTFLKQPVEVGDAMAAEGDDQCWSLRERRGVSTEVSATPCKSDVGRRAREAALRVVAMGGNVRKAVEKLKQACPEFENVAESTVYKYAQQIHNDEDLADAAQVVEYVPAPLGSTEPSSSTTALSTGTSEKPLTERRDLWIAKVTGLWHAVLARGKNRGLTDIMRRCSEEFGKDAALSGKTVRNYLVPPQAAEAT